MKVIKKINLETTCKLVSLLVISFALSSCALFQSSPKKQIKINIQTAHYLNPNMNGRPSPVVINMYQLANSSNFKQTDYKSLLRNSSAALDKDLIDKTFTEVRPNSQTNINLSVPTSVKYIGFAASYRNINNGRWRSVVELNPGTKTTYINLNLESRGFSAKKNKNKHFWNKF